MQVVLQDWIFDYGSTLNREAPNPKSWALTRMPKKELLTRNRGRVGCIWFREVFTAAPLCFVASGGRLSSIQ